MRTVLLANNRLGADVAHHLHGLGHLAGLVLHPPERQRHRAAFAGLDMPTWEWPAPLDEVRALAPECLLSVLFGYRLPAEWLAAPSWQALNLHPGLLPWNAGANPNVWPIVDGSPAGTTLHVMSERIDEGPILAQEEVPVHGDDTAETLYRRLETASLLMLREVWPRVRNLEPRAQGAGGSTHRAAELATLDPKPDELALVDRLRARTFPPYGAEFERAGRRYRVRVEIEEVT